MGVGWGGVGWDDNVHVPVRTQARQPHHTRAGGVSVPLSPWWSVLGAQQPKSSKTDIASLRLLGCAPCSPSGGPFWPLSSPNPPKRTYASSGPAWLSSLLSLWWSVLAAQQPKSSKTDLATLVGGPFWPLRSTANPSSHESFPCSSNLIGLCLSLPGAPFCPLSGPNPPKRTSPASSAWLCSLLSLVVRFGRSAAQIPPKRTFASLVCLAVLLALPLVVRFGRSAAQILQNGPSPAWSAWLCSLLSLWSSFWPLSSPNPSKRTSPIPPLAAGAGRGRTFNLQVKGLCPLPTGLDMPAIQEMFYKCWLKSGVS